MGSYGRGKLATALQGQTLAAIQLALFKSGGRERRREKDRRGETLKNGRKRSEVCRWRWEWDFPHRIKSTGRAMWNEYQFRMIGSSTDT